MIQRIQSIFLFLAAIVAVGLFFFPLAWFYGNDNTIAYYVYQAHDHVPSNGQLFSQSFFLPLAILAGLMIVLPFVIIFLYKKMQQQLKLIQLSIFLNLVFIGLVFLFYTEQLMKATAVEPNYSFGIFLPLIQLVFLVLALRSIRKDIKLIRSADSLR